MDGIMGGTELCCLCSLSVKRVVLEGLIMWRDKESEPLDFSLSLFLIEQSGCTVTSWSYHYSFFVVTMGPWPLLFRFSAFLYYI